MKRRGLKTLGLRKFGLAGLMLFSAHYMAQGTALAQDVPDAVDEALAAEKGCLSCHEGIEQFTDGAMMDAILLAGEDFSELAKAHSSCGREAWSGGPRALHRRGHAQHDIGECTRLRADQ